MPEPGIGETTDQPATCGPSGWAWRCLLAALLLAPVAILAIGLATETTHTLVLSLTAGLLAGVGMLAYAILGGFAGNRRTDDRALFAPNTDAG